MAESDTFQILENISQEVDNSQVKILISSHCSKAQSFLLDKLRKQTERQIEICKFISSSNLKLETEINFAKQEIKSLDVAIETIKLGNIELNKEYLLSKERKAEILERTTIGKKKYDNLWLMSKKKYESIPMVQKLTEAKNKNQTVGANIKALLNESKHLVNEIKIKKNNIEITDKSRIIELAEFLTHERNKKLLMIKENNVKIQEVLNEIETMQKEENKNISDVSIDQPIPTDSRQTVDTINNSILKDNWSSLSKNTDKDALLLPKLRLQNNDLDILNIKFDEINKADLQESKSLRRAASSPLSGLEENPYKIHRTEVNDDCISSYFNISADGDNKQLYNKNYSEKKLINILEDIKLDKKETYEITKKLEVSQFQATECIISQNNFEKNKSIPVQKNTSLEIEEIDEIKLPKTREEDLVDPPSQFLDVSQSSQEKKTVSFNIPIEIETPTSTEKDADKSKTAINNSPGIIVNVTTASEESYTTIKDNILRKRNLDLSPQFVYSKSTLMQKQNENRITSKFFESKNMAGVCNEENENDDNEMIKKDQILTFAGNEANMSYDNENCTTGENNIVVSSPKGEVNNLEVSVNGLLFNHGPQGISDSLNLSVSTTGLEDSEDFPHCIDSSVLLSPKADIPEIGQSTHNNEVLSQEVPNFLAGFRKKGLSFFGATTSSDTKPDSVDQARSDGFNFAFRNEKKGRGGFFSMFQ